MILAKPDSMRTKDSHHNLACGYLSSPPLLSLPYLVLSNKHFLSYHLRYRTSPCSNIIYHRRVDQSYNICMFRSTKMIGAFSLSWVSRLSVSIMSKGWNIQRRIYISPVRSYYRPAYIIYYIIHYNICLFIYNNNNIYNILIYNI